MDGALYLTQEKHNDTRSSEHGATVCSNLVATNRTLRLINTRYWRPTN